MSKTTTTKQAEADAKTESSPAWTNPFVTDPQRAADAMRDAMLSGLDGMIELNEEFARATNKTLAAMREQIERLGRPQGQA